MMLVTRGAVFHKFHLAREALIKARIARQKATIETELDMYFGDNGDNLDDAQALLDEARALRNEARDILIQIEKDNGSRRTIGWKVLPLKDHLVGRFFKCWKEFDVEYAKTGAPLFGSDPE